MPSPIHISPGAVPPHQTPEPPSAARTIPSVSAEVSRFPRNSSPQCADPSPGYEPMLCGCSSWWFVIPSGRDGGRARACERAGAREAMARAWPASISAHAAVEPTRPKLTASASSPWPSMARSWRPRWPPAPKNRRPTWGREPRSRRVTGWAAATCPALGTAVSWERWSSPIRIQHGRAHGTRTLPLRRA